MVTGHVPVPGQAPLQPAKVEPGAAVGVSVTTVPCGYAREQVAPQSIPAGELETLPLPVPALLTVSVWLGRSKVAVTERAWSIVTVHGPVPVQSPLQPVKVEPGVAVGVSVTDVPSEKSDEQVVPQLIPAGELPT
jgi:hypothetical protein